MKNDYIHTDLWWDAHVHRALRNLHKFFKHGTSSCFSLSCKTANSKKFEVKNTTTCHAQTWSFSFKLFVVNEVALLDNWFKSYKWFGVFNPVIVIDNHGYDGNHINGIIDLTDEGIGVRRSFL